MNRKKEMEFDPNKNENQNLSDGKVHFPLNIPGIGRLDCILSPGYDKLIIPEDMYERWLREGKISDTEYKKSTEVIRVRLIKLYGVRAYGKYIPVLMAAVWDGTTKVIMGKDLIRKIRSKRKIIKQNLIKIKA